MEQWWNGTDSGQMAMEQWWNGTDSGQMTMVLTVTTQALRLKPAWVLLCPTQISPGLTRDGTQDSAVTGWQLTTCAMASCFANTTHLQQSALPHCHYI
jgi:hypothetical protein